MRIGVSPWGSSFPGVIRVATAAAEAGLDTLWLGDGLLVVPDFPQWSGGMEPFVELSWLAGRFPSMAVGVGAAVLPLRDVMWVAKQASTLDQLTEGRFFLVVTPGIWEREFAFRGLSYSDRGSRYNDSISALLAAFAGLPHDGPEIVLPGDGRLSPVPFTPGGPPLWLAGDRATFERALDRSLPFQARATTPAELEPLAKEWFARGGGELGVRIGLRVAEEVAPSATNSDSVASANELAGPPAYLAEQLAAYSTLGVTDLSLMPGRDDETSLRTIDDLATKILPVLRP
jgi:alkanesulfonate monooxygenase SsuD/methylene tetrahydromethanopterin reductase-like flavin-dependent oxidoreductase (luciferase family)